MQATIKGRYPLTLILRGQHGLDTAMLPASVRPSEDTNGDTETNLIPRFPHVPVFRMRANSGVVPPLSLPYIRCTTTKIVARFITGWPELLVPVPTRS